MLINCAGIREYAGIEDVTPEQMMNSYQINAMGPIFTVQAMLKNKLLRPGSVVANVTSLVRSSSSSHAHLLCSTPGSVYCYGALFPETAQTSTPICA